MNTTTKVPTSEAGSAQDTESIELKKQQSDSAQEHTVEQSSENIEEEEDDKVSPNVEIYRQAWSKKVLIIAYAVLIFTAFVENFASQSTSGLSSYATSSFNAHSLIATAAVVYKITAIVSYPILAKLADFMGRAEGFGFSVLVYTLAYVLYAACQNAQTYVCAEIFYAIGKEGYRVFQQTFIADTTSLIDRGLWAQLPDAIAAVPALYVGSVLQDVFVDDLTWRWGYGIWGICLAGTTIPLTLVMVYLDRRAKQSGEQKIIAILQRLPEGSFMKRTGYFLYRELDVIGALLFLLGLALFFVPLTLTGKSSPYKWKEAKLIVMLVFGVAVFGLFLVWNCTYISKKLQKQSFIRPQSFTNVTIAVSCAMVALDLAENSSFATYFKTVLQVSGYYTVGEATRIDDSKKACVNIFSVVCGLMMKYTKWSRIYVFIGVPFVVLGHGLLVFFLNAHGDVADTGLLYMAEVFIGFGRGFYQTALLVIVQGIAGSEGIAVSTAFFLAFQSIGSLIGTCIAGGIWNSILLAKLKKYLPSTETKKAKKIYKSLTVALKYKKGTEERDAIARAYRETIQIIGWVGLGVIAPMLILMFFVATIKLTKHNDIYAADSESESDVEIDLKKEKDQVKL